MNNNPFGDNNKMSPSAQQARASSQENNKEARQFGKKDKGVSSPSFRIKLSTKSTSSPVSSATTSTKPSYDMNAAIPRKNRPLIKIPKKVKTPSSSSSSSSSAPSLILNRSSHDGKSLPPSHSSMSSTWKTSHGRSNNFTTQYNHHRDNGTISIKSEAPFVIHINTQQIPKENSFFQTKKRKSRITLSKASPQLRSSDRSTKRRSYIEMNDTDSDFLQDSDNENNETQEQEQPQNSKKRLKKMVFSNSNADSSTFSARDTAIPVSMTSSDNVSKATDSNVQIVINDQPMKILTADIESPPNGTLPSLWYSREIFRNIWVIEKIIGWKTRPKMELENKDEATVPEFNDENAKMMSDKLINYYIPRSKKRMELSRICPRKCPVVLQAFVDKETRKLQGECKNENESTKYKLRSQPNENNTEEVLLIKWRGRSHLHCSWERPEDLELFDTTNNTAKGKIKRYYQSQHMLLGQDWKRVLEEGRMASSTAHGHSISHALNDEKKKDDSVDTATIAEDEDYFQSDYLEVERIMACDENSLEMGVLSHQRALNVIAERDSEEQRQKELLGENCHHENDTSFLDKEKPWDPEDNVRYVVKWKGLQLSEITWEYWLYIKQHSVDQAEDFWQRQIAPDAQVIKQNRKDHPSMREYKKMVESPVYGFSKIERPIAPLDGIDASVSPKPDEDESIGLKLRSYQLEGVNWLLWNWWNKRSCILADEMGLGKTIQSMCFLEQLRNLPTTQVSGPFLIVAPLSLVNQWQSECATWAPDLNVILYHGSASARQFLLDQEFYYTEQFVSKSTAQKLKRQHITKFQILITTYEVVMKDLNTLSKIRWKALVVDEAHRLKNHQSRLFAELGSVPRDFCLLLTGTPLQNSTEELWSLLNFCDPKGFASPTDFLDKFSLLSDSKQVVELHTVLRPYLLRRVKEDVEKSLPPKEETILEVTLTPIQKNYYKAIYEKNTTFLFKGSKPNNSPSLMNVMMELRKCCNHPFLIKGAEERIISEATSKVKDGENMDPVLRWQKVLGEQLVQSSGKMVLLMKLLPKLQSGGHKVLIFSQMVRVLDLLEELLRFNTYRYERLDGSTRASARHAAVDRFNKKSYQRFVMLLSTRAGGLGLNLVSADTVIIFDSDWNPQNDLQAMARAHRIGQTRAVKVYRLLTAKTYEMHMFHSASMKLGLDRAVLAHQRQHDGETSKRKKTSLEKESHAKEIDQLLKKGAYDIFCDDDGEEAKQFMETDIDQLLERNSRTVTYGKTETPMSKGLGSFSKASFVSSAADGKDIDLDDPDFWSKAIGLEKPEDGLDENLLLLGEKRNRKQVQVYDPYAFFEEDEEKEKKRKAQKIQDEKSEKKRQKEEKKNKKGEDREQKKKNDTKTSKDKQASSLNPKSKEIEAERWAARDKKFKNDLMIKKQRRDEQKKILHAIAKDDPLVDRMKQAWEPHHRDGVIDSVLRFGFGRFCKVRHEASLTRIPIQDIEVFVRSYVYQLGVQASISLFIGYGCNDYDESASSISQILDSVDGIWVVSAMNSAMNLHQLIESQDRDVRLPQTLIDSAFVGNLRSGTALSSLYCLAFMNRLNNVIGSSIERILIAFGNEQLGKRGYYNGDISSLDIDLKARHVMIEELSHSIGCDGEVNFAGHNLYQSKPTPWWDRNCDLGLIIGTFYHGLSNYRTIFADKNLPFAKKIQESIKQMDCGQMYCNFNCITKSTSTIFTKAKLESRKKENKAKSESRNVEKDEKVKIESTGSNTDESGQHINEAGGNDVSEVMIGSTENGTLQTSLVSIFDLRNQIQEAVIANMSKIDVDDIVSKPLLPSTTCLDDRVYRLVGILQKANKEINTLTELSMKSNNIIGSKQLRSNIEVSNSVLNKTGLLENKECSPRGPFGTSNSSFYHDLESSNWTCMSTPKECRGEGIPATMTRHGLVALVYANDYTLEQMLENVNTDVIIKKISKESTQNNVSGSKLSTDDTINDPNELHTLNKIPDILRTDHDLRNGLCAALLCSGLPYIDSGNQSQLNVSIVADIAKRLISREMPLSTAQLVTYLNDVLIPHCLRLCLYCKDYGLGCNDNTVGDDNTNIINKVLKEKCREKATLPDPMCQICDHSLASIENASIILRRIKLCRTIQYIINISNNGGTRHEEIMQALKLCRNNGQLPLWWNAIHDYSLLQYVSKYGLLTIILDMNEEEEEKNRGNINNIAQDVGTTTTNITNTIFSHRLDCTALHTSQLKVHIHEFLFKGIPDENIESYIPHHIVQQASVEEMEGLVYEQIKEFTTTTTILDIEMRLNIIVGNLCRSGCLRSIIRDEVGDEQQQDQHNGKDLNWLYIDLPLFDHDQWIKSK